MAISPVPESPEKQFEEIMQAVADARIGMHWREIRKAYRVARKYLGQDNLTEDQVKRFEKLSPEMRAAMEKAGHFGEYGVGHAVAQRELPLALALVAAEIVQNHALPPESGCALKPHDEAYISTVRDPLVQASITARFPAMAQTRISKILAHIPA